eukprot:TRINITY_DN1831_c0_g1_i1.p1 TRINITY_DN1831_c0_g1~~TRINITY_DN1831_c0_g1_i1.p1  ORF type:complete len:497 (+),score=140.67 TRINITY_DN1831_c0_g1_i1:54-1544(+)
MDAHKAEELILTTLNNNDDGISDSGDFAKANKWEHNDLLGVLNRLQSFEIVELHKKENKVNMMTPDGEAAMGEGSPEVILFNAIPADVGASLSDITAKLGQAITKLGQGEAMKNKWIRMDKASGRVFRNVEKVEDQARDALKVLHSHPSEISADQLNILKRRRMVQEVLVKTFKVTKGAKYVVKFTKAVPDLTSDLLSSGAWKTATFKEYNLNVKGAVPEGGYLHPLMKVRSEIREIFIGMGFEEMPTNKYVESSFWNFDSLFQPQQHPARDAHDTFFLSAPEKCREIPQDYLERVKAMHTHGGHGSIGWRYDWKVDEARKNILRTHTTAVSSRMLYKLAQTGFKPAKYFSIDRVFRNETLDATHLAEFHQIEGLVADYEMTLANLLGVISQFFQRLGIPDVRFKPAYNPYTEPSMEIFGYHPLLKRWVELGNSGMFRPEMLKPMGLPENVRVIAWGLSLERPTMIKYGIDNIRDIFGPTIDLEYIKNNPICFIDS